MADLLSDCNSQQLVSDQEFQQVFCVRCRNTGCQLAAWGNSTFDRRVSTQVERLFNAQQADPRLPKYAKILAAEFTEMLEHAMRIETAAQRNDWEVPEINITDGQVEQASSQATAAVEAAVAGLSCLEGVQTEPSPNQQAALLLDQLQGCPPSEQEVEDNPAQPLEDPGTDPEETSDSPVMSRHPPRVFVPPKAANTPQQLGGVVVGGGPERPPEVVDPWAAPPPKPKIVPVGAKIRMGVSPKEKDS